MLCGLGIGGMGGSTDGVSCAASSGLFAAIYIHRKVELPVL
jgi:hypothetical protein